MPPASGFFLVAILWLGFAGCSYNDGEDGSDSNGLTIDLTGTWAGTWTSSTGESGTFSGDFLQDRPTQGGGSPTSLSGTASLEGSPCSALLSVEASVYPGGFVSPPYVSGTFTNRSITIEFFASVTIDSDALSGTYEVLVGGTCTGETGTIVASLSIPLQAPVVRGQSVTVYDDLGNSTTFVLIEGLDPHTGRLRWTRHQLAALAVPERSPDEPPGRTML